MSLPLFTCSLYCLIMRLQQYTHHPQYYPIWAFTSQHKFGVPRWLLWIMIVVMPNIGKRSTEGQKQQPLQSNKWGKSLRWWDHTKHVQNNLYLVLVMIVYSEHPSVIWGTSRISFESQTEWNDLIWMHCSVHNVHRWYNKCHDQPVITLCHWQKFTQHATETVRLW